MVKVNFQKRPLEKQQSYISRPSIKGICSVTTSKTSTATKAHSNHVISTGTTDLQSTKTKPTNVFYVWYTELCRRQNSSPLSAIRPTNLKNDQVLDFVADRIKIEDWGPLFNALRLDTSLHVIGIHSRIDKQTVVDDADTEEKVRRMKKWYGCICTKYVLRSLIRSLCTCLKNTHVLSCLELDGLLISGEFLQHILKGLTSNKTLKLISFKRCPIEDGGCYEICEILHHLPNIEVLNLSSCNLTIKSGEYIAKLIKFQQINRYCESWHSSLRYVEPEVNNMAGMKRITLNNNPKIGDKGLDLILDELIDDLWIKAIDMQRCNITEAISDKIFATLQYNRSLEVADFRHNELEQSTVAKILENLKNKQTEECEYNWCLSSTTLSSTIDLMSSTTNIKDLFCSKKSSINAKSTLKRQLTMPFLPRKVESKDFKENMKEIKVDVNTDSQSLVKAKEQLMKLYGKLKEETTKRQQAEEKCVELQNQVDELLGLQKNQMILKEFTNMRTYINKFVNFIKQNGNVDEHSPIIDDLQNALNDVQILAKPYEKVMKSLEIPDEKIFVSEIDIRNTNKRKGVNVQSLFENLTGKPIDDDSDGEGPDELDLHLDLASSINRSSSSYIDITDEITTRSSDSESVETMKKLLEELSQEEKLSSLSELSRSSSEAQPKLMKKINIKIPLAS